MAVLVGASLVLLAPAAPASTPLSECSAQLSNAAGGSWRCPPHDGYAIGPDGQPIKWTEALRAGQRIGRHGSEFAPMGLSHTKGSIPPSDLVGVPAVACDHSAHPVAQPQLCADLVPGSPARLTVLWLVENGYVGRVVSPST